MKFAHSGVSAKQMAQHLKPMCKSIARATKENPILMMHMKKYSGTQHKSMAGRLP